MTRRTRRRRVRAVLASGLVLGIGATGTLAAWTDTEHAGSTITAGTFGIVGSVDGTTFTDHPTLEAPATLNFQAPPTAMLPGDTTYALYSVRTTDASVPGAIRLNATDANADTLGQYLTYGVRTVPGPSCSASDFRNGSDVIAPGSPMTTDATQAQSLQAAAGNTVNYCFAVTLVPSAPNEVQGQAVTATWEFAATT